MLIMSDRTKLLILAICLGWVLPVAVDAQVPRSTINRIILGEVEYTAGTAWFVARDGSTRPATERMHISTGDRLKAGGITRLKFVNGNLLELSSGTVVEFSPQGKIMMISGQGELTLLQGEKLPIAEGEQLSIYLWPAYFKLMLDGTCHKIMLHDFLKLFIMAEGLEDKLTQDLLRLPIHEFYIQMNKLLEENDLLPFPSNIPVDCLKRNFYVDYFYALLGERFGWPEIALREDKQKAMLARGYLNPLWADEECICRPEALGMLWDAFLNIPPMAEETGSVLVDPYVAPFPNLYEDPISQIR